MGLSHRQGSTTGGTGAGVFPTSALRPSWAQPVQDGSFTLEDEHSLRIAETTLGGAICLLSPHEDLCPIVYANQGFETLTGFPQREAVGEDVLRLLQDGKPTPASQEELRPVLGLGSDSQPSPSTSGRPLGITVEFPCFRRDEQTFPTLMSVIPLRDVSGQLLHHACLQADLSKRDSPAEEQRATWHEHVQPVLQSFAVLECTVSSDGGCDSPSGQPNQEPATIVAISDGFASLTGYSFQEIKGFSLTALCGIGSNPETVSRLYRKIQSSVAVTMRVQCFRKDGSPFWALICTCPCAQPSAQNSHSHSHNESSSSAQRTLCFVVDVTASKPKRVGKYTLGKVIGTGAFGIVRLARRTDPIASVGEELVAVKILDATRFRSISEIEQVQEEMSVLSQLKHPHIIRLYEVLFIANVFYLVMEFGSGGSLMSYVRGNGLPAAGGGRGRFLPEEDAQRLFLQMISAVDFCHRRRIIHRDLKPENMLMDEGGNIKIADFGLVAVAAPFGSGLTTQCGTPEFTAPEIIAGKEYEGAAADIWSLGVILYELFCGSLPFQGSSSGALHKAIQRGIYDQLPSSVSPEARDLVRRMLTVDPTARAAMEDIQRHAWVRGGLASHSSSSRSMSNAAAAALASLEDGCNASRSSSPEELSAGSTLQVHDSVRVVISKYDKDDPISAALMRGQRLVDASDDLRVNGSTGSFLLVHPSSALHSPYGARDRIDSPFSQRGAATVGSAGGSKASAQGRSMTPSGGTAGRRAGAAHSGGSVTPGIGQRKALPPLSATAAQAERRGGAALLAGPGSGRFQSPSRATTTRSAPAKGKADVLPPIHGHLHGHANTPVRLARKQNS